MAEIYSIIVTLDGVEKAYIRDSITEAEYTEACHRLLKHYRTILTDETVADAFRDLESFKRRWQVRLDVISVSHVLYVCVCVCVRVQCEEAMMITDGVSSRHGTATYRHPGHG